MNEDELATFNINALNKIITNSLCKSGCMCGKYYTLNTVKKADNTTLIKCINHYINSETIKNYDHLRQHFNTFVNFLVTCHLIEPSTLSSILIFFDDEKIHGILNYQKTYGFDINKLLNCKVTFKISTFAYGSSSYGSSSCIATMLFVNMLFIKGYNKTLQYVNSHILLYEYLFNFLVSECNNQNMLKQISNINNTTFDILFNNDTYYKHDIFTSDLKEFKTKRNLICETLIKYCNISYDMLKKITQHLPMSYLQNEMLICSINNFNNFEKILKMIDVKNIDVINIFRKIKLDGSDQLPPNYYGQTTKDIQTCENLNDKYNLYVDLLVKCGVIIDKKIIIFLISQHCKINNFANLNIPFDDEMYYECAKNDFYPYEYPYCPPENVLITECSRINCSIHIQRSKKSIDILNPLIRLRHLKSIGSTFTQACMNSACKVKNNIAVINFLITECNLFVTFENIKDMFTLSVDESEQQIVSIFNNLKMYSQKQPSHEKFGSIVNILNEQNNVLNDDKLLHLQKKDIAIDKNIEYKINSKIINLLKCNKNIMKYDDIYILLLKYFITNKLVIGNYIVIDGEIENIIHIGKSTILHIDQLDSIITHLIKKNE